MLKKKSLISLASTLHDISNKLVTPVLLNVLTHKCLYLLPPFPGGESDPILQLYVYNNPIWPI